MSIVTISTTTVVDISGKAALRAFCLRTCVNPEPRAAQEATRKVACPLLFSLGDRPGDNFFLFLFIMLLLHIYLKIQKGFYCPKNS
jgi:hypothetical protein